VENRPGLANVLGQTVAITSGTKLGAAIAAGDGVRIRGFINRDGATVTATRIDKVNAVTAGKTIVQGPVKNIDATAHTFTILGIPISPSATIIARPNDDNSTDTLTMPLADFFSALTAGKTIVKAKGTFSAGTLTAAEIELE